MRTATDATLPFLTACVATEGDRRVVRPAGELDVAGREVVRAACLHPDAPGPVVEVDLAGLRFLDCSGVGALLEARSRLVERGGALTARHAAGVVALVLDVTGVGALLEGD